MDIERIKNQTPALLLDLGSALVRGRWFCPCCQQTHKNHASPDMVEWKPGKLKCHRCGFSGSIIDLYMQSRGATFGEAVDALSGGQFSAAMRATIVRTPNRKKVYPSHEDALAALSYRIGAPVKLWNYIVGGKLWMVVYRFDTTHGKEFRPISRVDTGWVIGRPQGQAPIYRHDDVVASNSLVIVAEGEKCADALWSLGLVATTSPGGANAAERCDWSPLKDRHVIVWMDNDEPGKKYGETIKKFLPQAKLWVPSCMNEGEDAADFVGRGGTLEQLRDQYKGDAKNQ